MEALPIARAAAWAPRLLVNPIFAPDRAVLGTFAMYYRDVRRPDAEDQQLIDAATNLAYVAIASDRLRQSEMDRQRMRQAVEYGEHLRSVILDSVDDAIFYMQAEADGGIKFVSVNRAFTELFGISNAEIADHWLHEILPDDKREATAAPDRRATDLG